MTSPVLRIRSKISEYVKEQPYSCDEPPARDLPARVIKKLSEKEKAASARMPLRLFLHIFVATSIRRTDVYS